MVVFVFFSCSNFSLSLIPGTFYNGFAHFSLKMFHLSLVSVLLLNVLWYF